jgi:hypothetical protein
MAGLQGNSGLSSDLERIDSSRKKTSPENANNTLLLMRDQLHVLQIGADPPGLVESADITSAGDLVRD